MSRKRNRKDRIRKKKTPNATLGRAILNNVGLDIRDRNLLPPVGAWSRVRSNVTGIVYEVKIGAIRRAR